MRNIYDLTSEQLTEKVTSAFWKRVDKTKTCWFWTGATNRNYGVLRIDGHQVSAHRISYVMTHGKIPDRLLILHHCDNPNCVNPAHLWAGTQVENVQDMVTKNRQRGSRNPGSKNGYAKLTESDVLQIRKLFEIGMSQVDIAIRFNVNKTNIHYIIKRKTWTHV